MVASEETTLRSGRRTPHCVTHGHMGCTTFPVTYSHTNAPARGWNARRWKLVEASFLALGSFSENFPKDVAKKEV